MTNFIGVKLVDAEPMTLGIYNSLRGREIPANEDPHAIGYCIRYSDGYISWCPKDIFKKSNLPFASDDNTITQEDVNVFIKQIHVDELEPNDLGHQVTVVTVTLANGFTITESSACVDPANYDSEIGIDCCMERIEDKIWFLLGFLLSCGVNGFQKGGTSNA